MVELVGDICMPSELHVKSLPTSDPEVDGMVWLNTNVLTMSTGPA